MSIEELDLLTAKLIKAEKILKFYANDLHWRDRSIIVSDVDKDWKGDLTYGGRRAREYFKWLKEKQS